MRKRRNAKGQGGKERNLGQQRLLQASQFVLSKPEELILG